MEETDARRLIRARLDPDVAQSTIESLTARAPTDRIQRTESGWTMRDEVPWFLLFAAVALVLLASIAHAGSARAPGFPRALRLLPWLMDVGWVFSTWGFFRRYWGRFTIALRDRALVFSWSFRDRVLREERLDPEDVQSVRVTGGKTVVVEGPRNQVLSKPFDAGLLDPPSLARWIADAIAALTERAMSR
jgi:hypothetical protein